MSTYEIVKVKAAKVSEDRNIKSLCKIWYTKRKNKEYERGFKVIYWYKKWIIERS